jgi:hypothetical protein
MMNQIREKLVLDENAFFGALGASGIRSIRGLARRLGRSTTWVAHMRAGIIPKPDDRELVANALGVSESQLWKWAVLK